MPCQGFTSASSRMLPVHMCTSLRHLHINRSLLFIVIVF